MLRAAPPGMRMLPLHAGLGPLGGGLPWCAQLIYSGPLGTQSSALIAYLEDVPGVHPISAGENPATWMLEVTGGASVTGQSRAASVDFAEYYKVPVMAGG